MESRPEIKEGEHPFETGEYFIPTAMIDKLTDKIDQNIEKRVPGIVAYGNSRLGKTWAIGYLTRWLKMTRGSYFPVFCTSFEEVLPQRKKFFRHLLKSVGYAISNESRQGEDDIIENLVNFIVTKTVIGNSKRIVFFMDEAQSLRHTQFKWLRDLYNRLIEKKVIPLFVLFGTQDLITKRNNFIGEGETQIVGRFMTNMIEFMGLISPDDIYVCLSGYDNAEYPAGKGWSFTRYFFPNCTWCMADEKQKAWNAFTKITSEAVIIVRKGIPMANFTLAVEHLMKTYQTEDEDFCGFSEAQWDEAVKQSFYGIA